MIQSFSHTSLVCCAFASLILSGILPAGSFAQEPTIRTTLPGLIKAASYNPLNAKIAYAAENETEGIFKSYDGGVTWQHLFRGPEPLELGSSAELGQIFIPPLDTNVLLVASKNIRYGIYRSTDGGYRWNQVLPNVNIGGESMTQLSDHTILFGQAGIGKLWRSTDLGITWDSISSITSHPDLCTFVASPVDDNILLAGAEGGAISRSSDRGQHWQVQRTSDGIEFADVPYILFDPSKPTRAYATLFQDPMESFLVSEDAGITWLPVSAPPQEWALAIDRRNGDHIWLGRFSAFDQLAGHFVESFDAGKSFIDRGLDTVVDIWMIKQAPSIEQRLMLATSSGVILVDYPLSVSEPTKSEALSVGFDLVTISTAEPSKLSIINMLGIEVLSIELSAGESSVSTASLPSGVYTALIRNKESLVASLRFSLVR